MAIEIERKFLLRSDAWRAAVVRSVPMSQGYLASDPQCSVRVRRQDLEAFLNIKSATLGIERLEFDYPIPVADAEALLQQLCGGRTVIKTRHYVPCGDHTWEIDEFEGANRGLVVAEIELTQTDEVFERPAWLGREVSDERRYYNVCLLEKPYSEWD